MDKRIKRVIVLVVVIVLLCIPHTVITYAEGVETTEESGDGDAEDGTEEGSEEDKGDVGEGEDTDEEKEEDKEEEKPPVKQFRAEIPKPDGENGFYITYPKIVITHVSERGVTKYRLTKKDEILSEGELSVKDEQTELSEEVFKDGEHCLTIWMEDEEGKELEEFRRQEVFRIDTKAPKIQIKAPQGFDAWYQKEVLLSVAGSDEYSGVQKLECFVNGRSVDEKEGEKGKFKITEASSGGKASEVTVVAKDRAGNKSSYIKPVFVDNSAPKVSIAGIEEFMITSAPVTVTYEIQEDNILSELSAFADWENVQGEKTVLPVPEWEKTKVGKKTVQTLEEDGIYEFHVSASDKAGYKAEQKMQVIIDKGNPVIGHVEELDGKYLRDFCWEKTPDELVKDFTTFSYEIRLDGSLYTIGKKIRAEGSHILEVQATDAAGNQALAKAKFVVDHTPPEITFTDVEEGKEYEEQNTFRISLGNTEDTIQQVQINGENKKINPGSKSLQYTVQECKDYEIKVKAADKAGNSSEKSIFFKVVPKKTLLEKVSEPVVRIFTGEEKEKKTENEPETAKKNFPVGMVSIIAIVVLVIAVGTGIWYYRKMRM